MELKVYDYRYHIEDLENKNKEVLRLIIDNEFMIVVEVINREIKNIFGIMNQYGHVQEQYNKKEVLAEVKRKFKLYALVTESKSF